MVYLNSKLWYYIQRETPIHVEGTLLYNFHVAQRKLEYKYPLVNDGEKIKFLVSASSKQDQ